MNAPTILDTVKMSEHGHAAIGAKITISILPPEIEVEPIVTFAYMSDDSDKISDHEHELLELPSLGISEQQLLSSRFSTHSHMMEGIEIGLGASTFTCTCTPPPIPDDSGKSSNRRNNHENKRTSQSAFSAVRTKRCSKEQLLSLFRNQLQQKLNQKIKRNEIEQL